jgi:cell division protein ZapB
MISDDDRPDLFSSDATRVDPGRADARRAEAAPAGSVQQEVTALARQIDRLLDTVRRLSEENRSLRHSQEQLTSERAGLVARNEQARSRVEAMIQRLKSLENNG